MSKPTRPFMKRFTLAGWAIAGFFAAGYIPTQWTPLVPFSVRITMILSAAMIAPIGMRSKNLWQGGWRGLLLGLLAGIASAGGLRPAIDPARYAPIALTAMIGTPALTTAVGALFGYLAKKRRDQIEREWWEKDE